MLSLFSLHKSYVQMLLLYRYITVL